MVAPQPEMNVEKESKPWKWIAIAGGRDRHSGGQGQHGDGDAMVRLLRATWTHLLVKVDYPGRNTLCFRGR